MTLGGMPERLQQEIGRALVPAPPLPGPWRRALWPLLVGVLLLAGVPRVWSLRWDAATIGPWRLQVASVLQVLMGIVLIATALRESIPGRLSPLRALLAPILGGVGFLLALTFATWGVSPTRAPSNLGRVYFETCLTRSFGLGLLPLGVAFWLLSRGLPARPVVTGALAGLGAGLLADSSWRLFCEVSDPRHVLTAHAGAVLLVTLAGAFGGVLIRRLGAPRGLTARQPGDPGP